MTAPPLGPGVYSFDPLANPMPHYGRTKLVAGGPWVPARIWAVEHRDPETGDLLCDVVYFAEVAGKPTSPFEPYRWPWTPIDEAEFRYLTDLMAWSQRWARNEPLARPNRPMNRNSATFV